VEAWVEDKLNRQASKVNSFDVNLYISLQIPNTVSWSASAGMSNVKANDMPFSVQYSSNAVVKMQISATNPTSQYGDSFAASNLRISGTNNTKGPDAQNLSGSLANWKTTLGVSDEGRVDAYWFVSVPSGQPTGTYTFTYTMNMVFQDFAT